MPTTPTSVPLPAEFLTWQVELRRNTMEHDGGRPHVGVAPLLSVRRSRRALSVSTHSIICGILPRPDLLETKTGDFERLYQQHSPAGAKVVYDRGLEYLKQYYTNADAFDRSSLTTLLAGDADLVAALRAEPACQLTFYVFNLVERSGVSRLRCLSLDCEAELLQRGPVYDNVWWHNTLFHGPMDEAVVVHFHHRASWDTVFGRHDALG